MMRRPPRSTQSRSSAASDVYKRQVLSATQIRRQSLLKQFPHEQISELAHEHSVAAFSCKNLTIAKSFIKKSRKRFGTDFRANNHLKTCPWRHHFWDLLQ